MNAKLTLKLDDSAIARAKRYARLHHISLSKMVEAFFVVLAKGDHSEFKLTPIVAELSGVLSDRDTASWRGNYAAYLNKKYSK